MTTLLVQLVDADDPMKGGPYFGMEPVPLPGDYVDHPRIKGFVERRAFKFMEGPDHDGRLHYIQLHLGPA